MVRNVEIQHEKAYRKGIDLVADVDEKLSAFADVNMLDTVLRNLISNAIKFTQESGTVRIIAEQKEVGFMFAFRQGTKTSLEFDV